MLNYNEVIKMAMQNTLHALADPTRREILNLLKQSRMSAGDIVKYFSISGAAISRQHDQLYLLRLGNCSAL